MKPRIPGSLLPGSLLRGRLARAPVRLYDRDLGWLLGHRFLMLTHIGRRSGRHYRTVLEVIGNDRSAGEVVVISGLGHNADWYRNILARPAVEVAVARRRFCPVQRVLDEPEAIAVLSAYERRHRWAAPVLHRLLGWLVGWRYDGSDDARQRFVRELPLVAFRPADNGTRLT